MKELCWFQARPLCHLIEDRVPVERGGKSDPALWLDRLAAIFRNATIKIYDSNETHPYKTAANEVIN
jgi:transportin-3